MRTKLGLLLNLCRHSEFLILDEPSEGLDPVMTEQMLRSLVQQAADGTTNLSRLIRLRRLSKSPITS